MLYLPYPAGIIRMRAVQLAELGRVINPMSPRRMLAVLNVYFDGSAKNDLPQVAVVAGNVAPLAEWIDVEDKWQAELDYWKIDSFTCANCDFYLATSLLRPASHT